MGFAKENIILSGQQKSNQEILECNYIYCTEGNTFEVMSLLREQRLDKVFVEVFQKGATYIGASAGALIAGDSIEPALDFDRNCIHMTDFRGLGLFDGVIIPHYTKAELKRYIKNSPGIEEEYKLIYHVPNTGVVVLG